MFTGLVETVGTIKTLDREAEHVRLTVESPEWLLTDAQLGDSISVNGVCLTVIAFTPTTASFDAVYETMRKTSLGHLRAGSVVNLERPLAANGRFGGHIVQGHVDATGSIASIRQIDNSYVIYVDVPRDLMRYIVRKGSITVDGISLTVVDAEDKTFSVSIIPHTWEMTNLRDKRAGDLVNIETDIIAKYVERMNGLEPSRGEPSGPVLIGGRGARDPFDEPDYYGGMRRIETQLENSQFENSQFDGPAMQTMG